MDKGPRWHETSAHDLPDPDQFVTVYKRCGKTGYFTGKVLEKANGFGVPVPYCWESSVPEVVNKGTTSAWLGIGAGVRVPFNDSWWMPFPNGITLTGGVSRNFSTGRPVAEDDE